MTRISESSFVIRFSLLVAASLLCAFVFGSAHAAISLFNIGATNDKTADSTQLQLTTMDSVAAGDSIIVTFAMDAAAGNVSCSDPVNGTYDIDVDENTGGDVRTVIFSAHNVSALSTGSTITVAHPSAEARAMSAFKSSGLATLSTLDTTASAYGSSDSPSSGLTGTTEVADELLIGAIGVEGPSSDTFITGSGWTSSPDWRSGTTGNPAHSNITINPEYQIVSATGTYQADGTITDRDWAAAIATYKDYVDVRLADHAAGQEESKLMEPSVTGAELFAFQLTNYSGSTKTVTQIVFDLSSVSGVADTQFDNLYIYVDDDGDGTIEAGETTIVGDPDVEGVVSITEPNGTITFSSISGWTIAAETTVNYILKGDVNNLEGGDTLTISLSSDDLTLQAGTKDGTTTSLTHTAPIINYRSIGTNAGNLRTGTPTITISSGTATLSEEQTGNIGIGDKITYALIDTVYITEKIDNWNFTVRAEDGSVPSDVSDPKTVNFIERAYNALQDWEDPLASNGRGGNLVSENRLEVGVCYKDGLFTSTDPQVLDITGNTTDSNHYFVLTVAEGNRHDGTAGATGTSNAMIDGENGGRKGIYIQNGQDVRIMWLELKNFSNAHYANGVEIGGVGSNVQLEYLLVHDFYDATANNCMGIKLSGSGNNTMTVRNSIVYNGDYKGIAADDATDTVTIDNCTVYGVLGDGIDAEDTSVVIRNTISMNNGIIDFDLNGSTTQENNISSDATADCGTCLFNLDATDDPDPGARAAGARARDRRGQRLCRRHRPGHPDQHVHRAGLHADGLRGRDPPGPAQKDDDAAQFL